MSDAVASRSLRLSWAQREALLACGGSLSVFGGRSLFTSAASVADLSRSLALVPPFAGVAVSFASLPARFIALTSFGVFGGVVFLREQRAWGSQRKEEEQESDVLNVHG